MTFLQAINLVQILKKKYIFRNQGRVIKIKSKEKVKLTLSGQADRKDEMEQKRP